MNKIINMVELGNSTSSCPLLGFDLAEAGQKFFNSRVRELKVVGLVCSTSKEEKG